MERSAVASYEPSPHHLHKLTRHMTIWHVSTDKVTLNRCDPDCLSPQGVCGIGEGDGEGVTLPLQATKQARVGLSDAGRLRGADSNLRATGWWVSKACTKPYHKHAQNPSVSIHKTLSKACTGRLHRYPNTPSPPATKCTGIHLTSWFRCFHSH